ncbi:unnamed protein product [Prunus brigantina]
MTHDRDRTVVAGGSTMDRGGTTMKVFKSGCEAVRLQGYHGHGAVSLSCGFVYGALRQRKAYGDSSLWWYRGTGCSGVRDHKDRRRLRLSDEKDETDSFDQEHTLSITRALNESTNLFVQIFSGRIFACRFFTLRASSLSSLICGMLAKGPSMPMLVQLDL